MPNASEAIETSGHASLVNLTELQKHIAKHEGALHGDEYDPVANPRIMEPLLLKQSFATEIFDDDLYFDLFGKIACAAPTVIEGLFRVYLDGLLSPRHDLEVLKVRPLPLEGFETFITRACGGGKFGVVINGAEKWSDSLARLAVELFGPVAEIQGTNRSMIEVTLFIGNYGYTPFGIHLDDPYTLVVHLHAGPSTKEMTLFERDKFHSLNGDSTHCFEPSTLVEHGKTYAIEAGDAFLLPPHYYHVGRTDGYSVGLAFAVSKYSNAVLAKKVLQLAIQERRLIDTYELVVNRSEDEDESLAEWLVRSNRRYGAKKESLRNLRYPFQRKPLADVPTDCLWMRDPDFPIAFVEEPKDLIVYARGNRIRLSPGALTRRLVSSVPYEPFTVEQLQRELDGKVSLPALQAFIRELALAGGLLFCSDNLDSFELSEIRKASREARFI